MTSSCNPVFSDQWETVADIKRRTGLTGTTIVQAAKAAFQAGLISMRQTGDWSLKIPEFRRREKQP